MKNTINYTNKARAALKTFSEQIENGEQLHVTISNGNNKMGAIPSVSILPILTCPAACKGTCANDCYAAKLANLRPSVLNSYAKNTAILLHDPETYWEEINDALKAFRFFRFHVAGDIFGIPYFENMVNAARNNPHCEILAFTKAFKTVNSWIEKNGPLPENLHILFSGWTNLKPENPHNLPETNIITKDMQEIPENWNICGGNCFECACRGVACWKAQNCETIAFYKH